MFVYTVFFILYVSQHSEACSYTCPEDQRPCIDNVWGSVTSDCLGFLGCVNLTQSCAGECPSETPILGEDGITCMACKEIDGNATALCPECNEDEFWCDAESICKSKYDLCDGACPSILYPVKSSTSCQPCPEFSHWCSEEQKCVDPETEPCGGRCLSFSKQFCPDQNSCISFGSSCDEDTTTETSLNEPMDHKEEDELPSSAPLKVGPILNLDEANTKFELSSEYQVLLPVVKLTSGSLPNVNFQNITELPGLIGWIPLPLLKVKAAQEPQDDVKELL